MLNEGDRFLVDALKKGEHWAFEVLFKGFYSDLCKYANTLVNSRETAQDLVSDIYVKIWEDPGTLAVNKSLKGYLFRSVHNSCINHVTRKQKKIQNLDAELVEKLQALLPQLSEDDFCSDLFAGEIEEKMKQAVKNLPDENRKIFKMSREKLLSNKEIARELGISENTVRVQIFRALSRIRDSLKEYL